MTAKLITAITPPIAEPTFGIMATAQMELSKNNNAEPSTNAASEVTLVLKKEK